MNETDGRIEALSRVELLQGMSRDHVTRFAERCTFSRVRKGEPVIAADDAGSASTDAFLVLEGRLAARSRSANGQEITFATVGSGGLFGEFSAIDGAPRSAEIVAVAPSWVARVSSQRLRELILVLPVTGLRLCELLVAKNREMSQRLFEFATMDVRSRILATLHRLALAQGERPDGSGAIVVPLPPTQYEIAITAGTQRESVSREMAALARSGAISYSRSRLTVHDLDALAAGGKDT